MLSPTKEPAEIEQAKMKLSEMNLAKKGETIRDAVIIKITKNGPLLVEGNCVIVDQEGRRIVI